MIRPMSGRYKIQIRRPQAALHRSDPITDEFEAVSLKHIPRELNAEADKLANDAVRYVYQKNSD